MRIARFLSVFQFACAGLAVGALIAQSSPGALAQFQRARKIRDTFFPTGGQSPSVSFELTPLTMDPSISRFLLDIEGQRITYDHGPAIPSTVTWPGNGPRQVRIGPIPRSRRCNAGGYRSGARVAHKRRRCKRRTGRRHDGAALGSWRVSPLALRVSTF